MTDAQRATLAAYVRQLADLMELRDWRFTLRDDPPGEINHEEADATIRATNCRKYACLWVPAAWWDEPPEHRRRTICHELLHCHLWPAEASLESVQTNLGDAAWGVLNSLHRDAVEYAVDAIADALAPHLPLPPEGP